MSAFSFTRICRTGVCIINTGSVGLWQSLELLHCPNYQNNESKNVTLIIIIIFLYKLSVFSFSLEQKLQKCSFFFCSITSYFPVVLSTKVDLQRHILRGVFSGLPIQNWPLYYFLHTEPNTTVICEGGNLRHSGPASVLVGKPSSSWHSPPVSLHGPRRATVSLRAGWPGGCIRDKEEKVVIC